MTRHFLRSSDLATEYCVVNPHADNGDDHAAEIEAGNSDPAQGVENEAPDNGPNNAEHGIEKKALTRLVDDFAGNEARDQPQDNPPDAPRQCGESRPSVRLVAIARSTHPVDPRRALRAPLSETC